MDAVIMRNWFAEMLTKKSVFPLQTKGTLVQFSDLYVSRILIHNLPEPVNDSNHQNRITKTKYLIISYSLTRDKQ